MGENQMLPCQNCGADLLHADAEETTALVKDGSGFQFGGKEATREVPALICPECDEVTAL